MINVFLVIGLVIAFSGLILALIAKRLSINPFIGFRIGYTYASKKIWVKYNRLAGISFFIIGLIIVFLSLLIQSIPLLTILVLALVFSNTALLSFLAAREAERELGREAFKIEDIHRKAGRKVSRIEPVKPSPLRLLLMILPPVLSILLTIHYLPVLPERIAVHFNIAGEPDRWENLSTFISSTLPFLIGFQFLPIMFVLIEFEAPLFFYKPGIPKKEVVSIIYDIGIFVSWSIFLALIDILYYAVYRAHIVPGELFVLMIFSILTYIFIRAIILWRKWRKKLKEMYSYSSHSN